MTWTEIKALRENRAAKFAEAKTIRDTAAAAKTDLTPEQETRHTALMSEVATIGKTIEREEGANAVGEAFGEQRAAGNQPGRENGTPNSLGMPEKDLRNYSLVRAINRRLAGQEIDGLEKEVSEEIALRSGKKPQGFYFPSEARMSANGRQNRTILDTTQGAGAIPTLLEPNLIEALRNKIVTAAMGATIMPGMTSPFAIPKQTGVTSSYWVAEAGAPTGSYPTIGQVAFAPKTVGAYTDISRKFLNQPVISAEQFVRDDLSKVLALALELAALQGTGASNQPLGIQPNIVANATGQIYSLGTNGAAPTFVSMVGMETLVANANADVNRLGYVTNSKVRGVLKTTVKAASAVAAGFVFQDGQVNGYPVGVTNLMPSNGTKGTATGTLSSVLFGDWSSLYFALFSGLDVLVDPYTGGTAGTVRIVCLQDADINVRHLESFSLITDAIA